MEIIEIEDIIIKEKDTTEEFDEECGNEIIDVEKELMNVQPEDPTDTFELEDIKKKIESMDKFHHIEILKILKHSSSIKLNENKSGIFVNLSFLPKGILDEIKKYIDYIDVQENSISQLEIQCDEFKNTFFIDKEDKDNTILYSRNT